MTQAPEAWSMKDARVLETEVLVPKPKLCAVGHDCLALSVANPAVSPEHCLRVGAEHLAYETREALVDGIDTPLSFEECAAMLSASSTWWFWWD